MRVRSFALALVLSLASFARAQSTNVGDDIAPPIPGAGHDYIHLLSETVNPANGTVNINIKLSTPRGRGVSLPFSITYNSGPAWHFISTGVGQGYFVSDHYPDTGGWSTSLPYLTYSNSSDDFPYGNGLPGSPVETCWFSTGYVFYDPSGEGHDLNLAAMSPRPFSNGDCGRQRWV